MDAVARFTELVTRRRPQLDVAMLAIAAGADPSLDERRWLGELDRLAVGVDSLDSLLHRLYRVEGFAGNTQNYYDPRNSLLHHVLDRRLGIPITLAVVCMEVGRRAGVALEGVGMPGHFLLRPLGPSGTFLDPFTGSRLLSLAECEALFRAATGSTGTFGLHLLATAPTVAILSRVLQNLRNSYRSLGRAADLEWVLRMRLALPGVTAEELVELGEAIAQQGRWLDGARLLDDAAADHPADAELLARAARSLRAQLN
jgi:regulator of sirC expression with transglutaminase-like and TPR domain